MESVCNITCNCSEEDITPTCISRGVMGGIGAVMCTVALIIVLVSRFYKDTVQRLILYKLVTVLFFSLSQFLFLSDDASMYGSLLAITLYYVNLLLTFSLTIVLYLCIVHDKELKKFKKPEPVAVIISCLPFISFCLIPLIMKCKCKSLMYIYITGYRIAVLLCLITSVLLVIIFYNVRKRSRPPLQGQDDNQAESPLLTSNRWKTLSKQLLPLVAYPIVNIIVTMIVLSLSTANYTENIENNTDTSLCALSIVVHTLQASLGLVTSIVVILHLVIVKCTKRGRRKRRRRKEREESREALCIVTSNHNDVFTNETVASTDASTSYLVPRTSLTLSQLVVN